MFLGFLLNREPTSALLIKLEVTYSTTIRQRTGLLIDIQNLLMTYYTLPNYI
jgi:hypothetical protein